MKKILALALAMVMVLGVLAGCNKAPAETTGASEDTKASADTKTPAGDTTNTPADNVWYTANDVTEVPDYAGDPLTVEVWYYAYSPNAGGSTFDKATSGTHVVNEELKRITGVEISQDSFYNNEATAQEMVAKMVASEDFPDVIHTGKQVYQELAKAGYLWDLQDLINPENTPILYSMIGPDNPVYGNVWNDTIENDGGLFIFEPGVIQGTATKIGDQYPEEYPMWALTDEQKMHMNIGSVDYDKGYVYVKQEYLDQLFPGCHTTASWQALLEEKGELTQEDILDIPINSNADFEKMLYDIKAIIDEDGSSKYVWASRNGTDNWSFNCQHSFVWGHQTNYTSYFDLAAGEIKKSLEQDFWKEQLKQINKWYRDGILDPEAYIYTFEQYKEHVANNEYAVVMYDFNPTACGHPNQDEVYRKVFLNYSATANKDILVSMFAPSLSMYNCLSLVKGGNLDTEEKVVQFLRYIEFQLTEAGSKLKNFGTPELGLYTEAEDGTIVAAGELAAIEGEWSNANPAALELQKKYGLCGSDAFPRACLASTWLTHSWQAIDTRPLSLNTYTNPTVMFPAEDRLGSNGCAVHTDVALNYGNDGMDDWWNARTDWESYMTKVELAQSDEEFEQRYQEMLDHIAEVGFDDEALAQFNKDYCEKYADYIKLEQDKNAAR